MLLLVLTLLLNWLLPLQLPLFLTFRMLTLPNGTRDSRELWDTCLSEASLCPIRLAHGSFGDPPTAGNGCAIAFLCLLSGAQLGAKQRK